jgi:choline dehydrogenase-like flavoprotein
MSTTVIRGATIHGAQKMDADVVVIGSGAGGAAAAYELVNAGLSVIVLEAGPHVVPEEFTQRELDTIKRLYVDQGSQGPADGSIQILQARAIGGSTIINGEVCFRIPDPVLEEWSREHGVRGLSSAEMKGAFEDVERMIHATPNTGRELSGGERLERGIVKLGLTAKPIVRSVKGCRGCAYCLAGCAWGCKQSTDQSYIPAAMAKSARVISDARVERIDLDGGRARGVSAKTPEGRIDVRARAVVVACGTIETALLLLDHRLGGPDVGRHLALHPVVPLAGWFDDDVVTYRTNMAATYTDAWLGEGVLIEAVTATPPFLAAGISGFGHAQKESARDLGHASFAIAIVRDDGGTGRVKRDRKGAKVIDWRLDARGATRVRLAIRRFAEVAFAAGARKVMLSTTIPRPVTPDKLAEIDTMPLGPADVAFISYHPQGTARLGTVTDMDGAVKGVRDLYVMDASLFPSPVGVNTQVPVMGVATVLARRLAAKMR